MGLVWGFRAHAVIIALLMSSAVRSDARYCARGTVATFKIDVGCISSHFAVSPDNAWSRRPWADSVSKWPCGRLLLDLLDYAPCRHLSGEVSLSGDSDGQVSGKASAQTDSGYSADGSVEAVASGQGANADAGMFASTSRSSGLVAGGGHAKVRAGEMWRTSAYSSSC